jgi:hypothetical protein
MNRIVGQKRAGPPEADEVVSVVQSSDAFIFVASSSIVGSPGAETRAFEAGVGWGLGGGSLSYLLLDCMLDIQIAPGSSGLGLFWRRVLETVERGHNSLRRSLRKPIGYSQVRLGWCHGLWN